MFQGMYGKFLMAFKDNQIMSVAFMISEKQILTMYGIYIFPILQSQFDCGKRRMSVEFITYIMQFKEVEDFLDFIILYHLFKLFA